MREKRQTQDRREFTWSLMAAFSGVAVTISACGGGGGAGGGGGTSPTGGSPMPGDGASGRISNNHGHSATITSAELADGGAVTLSIQGSGDHDHTVSLSSDEVGQVASGQRVSVRSSNDDGHFHEVIFN
jgi:hypothetical protein